MDKIDMIMFDLDGTLWEVSDITNQSANEILKLHNIDYNIPVSVTDGCMGFTFEECAKKYMPFLEKKERENLMTEICDLNFEKIILRGGNVFEGVSSVLNELSQSYKIALVSNCSDDNYIKAFFKVSNTEKAFSDFMAASKYRISKAEAIKVVQNRNNSKNVVYVGDTVKDQEAANEAGVNFVHATYGFGKNVNSYFKINKIYDLIELLKNM